MGTTGPAQRRQVAPAHPGRDLRDASLITTAAHAGGRAAAAAPLRHCCRTLRARRRTLGSPACQGPPPLCYDAAGPPPRSTAAVCTSSPGLSPRSLTPRDARPLGQRTSAAAHAAIWPPLLASSTSSLSEPTSAAMATASPASRRIAMLPAPPRLRRGGMRASATRLPGCGAGGQGA